VERSPREKESRRGRKTSQMRAYSEFRGNLNRERKCNFMSIQKGSKRLPDDLLTPEKETPYKLVYRQRADKNQGQENAENVRVGNVTG